MKMTFEWLVTKDNEVLFRLPNGNYRLIGDMGNMTMKEFFSSCSLSQEEKDACAKEHEEAVEQSQNQAKEESIQHELPLRDQLPLISELPKSEALYYGTAEQFIRFNLIGLGWPDSRGFRSAVSRRLTKISNARNFRMVIIPTHNGKNKVYGFHRYARGILLKELASDKYGNLEKYRPSH